MHQTILNVYAQAISLANMLVGKDYFAGGAGRRGACASIQSCIGIASPFNMLSFNVHSRDENGCKIIFFANIV